LNTALIALDFIVDIMHPSGRIARSAGQAADRGIVPRMNLALTHARSEGWLAVLVKVGFHPGYPELPRRSPIFGRAQEFGALQLGAPGTEFHPDLDVDGSEAVVVKPRISAFHGTYLEPMLRARAIERVVLAGVSTTWAVQATARDAHDRDFEVVVLEDACAAADAADHEASIRQLRAIATITTVAELGSL
jgi:nicotinamidase-related amidase